MGKFSRLGNDLYTGKKSWDFIGRKGVWYLVSVILILTSAGFLVGKGLNLGIEFTGGTQFSVTSLDAGQNDQDTADELRQVVGGSGVEEAAAPEVTTSDSGINIQVEPLGADQTDEIGALISDSLEGSPEVSISEIGPSLGAQIAQRAAIGVAIFLFLVVLFIWAYFREWKMSIAALIALFHDILLTTGVYAITGFTVTPAAVTGLLAILGFSLYDTVVVFDKVRENTKDLRRMKMSYAQAANLAVNQTVVRSINTAIVALIPIGAILYISASSLGASSLEDLALAQFVGTAVGVYSSIFLAPRVLVQMKSSESEVKLADKRAKSRARAAADPYAAVPSFAEDMPIGEPDTDYRSGSGLADADDDGLHEDGFDDDVPPASPSRAGSSQEPMGRGRTAPAARGPMGTSNASQRQQPSRRTKSQRKK